MFLVLLTNALLALIYTLDKELLYYLPPLLFLAMRTLICGSLFGLFFFIFRKKEYKISYKKLLVLSIISIFYIYLTNFFLYKGFTVLTSSKATLIYNLNPFIVAALSFFIFKEKYSFQKIAGLLIGWLGFIPILFFENSSQDSWFNLSWAEASVVVAAFCAAISFILLQKLLHKQARIPASLTSAIMLFVGGLYALFNSIITEKPLLSLKLFFSNGYVLMLFIAIVIITIAWSYVNCLVSQKHKASLLSFAGSITPLYAVLFEWLFFSRTVGKNFYISLVFVALGLFLFYRAEQKIAREKCNIN